MPTTDEIIAPSPLRLHRPNKAVLIALGLGLMSLVMSLSELSSSRILSFYDSGVYVAAAIHFVSGAMPYRDFSFVQPPGIVLILSPVALFSRIFGSHDGFVLATVVSSFVAACNVSLIAWLVRHRGTAAMMIAGGGFAVLPVTIYVASSVKLDSYCVLFVLLGAIALFSREQDGGGLSNQRLIVGGVLFGVAALMKIWAFFPFVAATLCLVPMYRQRVIRFVGSAFSAFALISLPFFIAAPTNFISQVIVEQINRKPVPSSTGSVSLRLIDLTGFLDTSLAPTIAVTLFAFLAFAALTYFAFRQRVRANPIDVFLVLASVCTVAGLLLAHETYIYYAYFAEPFLFGLLGVSVARLIPAGGRIVHRVGVSDIVRTSATLVISIAGCVALLSTATWTVNRYYNVASRIGYPMALSTEIDELIPPGSCVVYDIVSIGVIANRLENEDPTCPNVVDPGGQWMAWGYQLIPPAPAFIQIWQNYFESAQYVVFVERKGFNVPWNSELNEWFNSHYRLISGDEPLLIYERSS